MGSLFTDTITIYNRRVSLDPKGGVSVLFNRTVIDGVMWKDSTRVNQTSEGASLPDKTVSITIPVEADQSGKTYVRPSDYTRLPQNDDNHWTVRTAADANEADIIVLGEGQELTEDYTIDNLQRDYRHMKPTRVADSSEQRILPQWKVTGV